MRLLAYNHYLEKTVIMYLLSAACGTYIIILECNYYTKIKGYYFYIKVIQSALICHCKEKYIYIYIYSAANIYNFDELVTSRKNQKKFTYIFL
jgi:hypothetical protein